MKTKYILGMLLSAAVLFTGCKFDDDDIWNELDKHAERLAALEAWQQTVNGNITSLQQLVAALENNDYVTGVVPFDTPAPGGYRITFTQSGEATIWNGTKGDKGETGATGATGHAPVVGVAEFPAGSGVYYWTLDGEWITDDGNKTPVTGPKGDDGEPGTPGTPGAPGATPKVAIGSDGYWYISADGTATGTAPGTGWTNTNMKATGEKGETGATGSQGEKGDQGDAIFAANGISQTDDAVTFTLANDGGTITLPKYKGLSIAFADAEDFTFDVLPEGMTSFGYATTGTVQGVGIASALPEGWKISVDESEMTLNITAPNMIESIKVLLVLTGEGGVSASYWLTVNAGGLFGLIPDENFRIYCQQFDEDEDDILTRSEARAVTQINVSSNNIWSLKGIEYFTELTRLNCDNNQLFGLLDLSNNTKLTYLYCYNNQLSGLDLSNNTKLIRLDCYENQLSGLDLSNNTELTTLVCYENQLKELDLSNNTKLTYLGCDNNQLKELDLSKNTELKTLDCGYNQLKELDLSKNMKLTYLYCDKNQLSALDLSNNTKLTYLDCYKNQLKELDLSKNTELITLHCYENQLSGLDLSNNSKLTYLDCYKNQLTAVDISVCKSLGYFDATENPDLETVWVWEGFDINDPPGSFYLPDYKKPKEVYKVKQS